MPSTNATDLAETLRLHALWHADQPGGVRADLGGAYLGGANLREANLGGANLREANLEGARLPEGMHWWQGGSYGPRRRMIRVLRVGDTVTVMAGCIAGTRDDVARRLSVTRHPEWVSENRPGRRRPVARPRPRPDRHGLRAGGRMTVHGERFCEVPNPDAVRRPSMEQLIVELAEHTGRPTFRVAAEPVTKLHIARRSRWAR